MPAPTPTTDLDNGLLAELLTDPRVTVRKGGPFAPGAGCVVLWMQRAQRASDNPALGVAVRIANRLDLPVVAFLGFMPRYPRATLRAYAFLFDGAAEVEADLARLGIPLVVRPFPDHHVVPFAKEVRAAVIVGDENPMREPASWRRDVAASASCPVVTVETECLVPPALFEKQEFAARTLRPKYHRIMDTWLRPEPVELPKRAWSSPPRGVTTKGLAVPDSWKIDRTVTPVSTFASGPLSARRALAAFVKERLPGYAENRNQPDLTLTSRLSPWLHFGHLGPRDVACAVATSSAPRPDRDAFLEEFLVRRELAYNYTLRQPRYDSLAGCPAWALKSLDEHRKDPRPYLYDADTLVAAKTHDDLWNAAQTEMVTTGHMHGYVRMYWAKKILEWSPTPEAAFDVALAMNDAYELDGRDPNGFTGIAWAIGGLHDRPWAPARPVFGMVRFMSYASTGKKFDKKAYIARAHGSTGLFG